MVEPATTESVVSAVESESLDAADFRWVVVLVVLLLLPTELSLNLGGLRLSPYRFALLAAFFPMCAFVFGGRAGKLLPSDMLVVVHVVWCSLAYAVRDGMGAAIESGGIYSAEVLSAYLIGRACVRDGQSFARMSRVLFAGVVALLAVSLPETLTGVRFVHDIAGAIFGGRPPTAVEGRFGLARAYGPFDHPILLGTFCACAFSVSWFASTSKGIAHRLKRGAVVGTASFAALSSSCIMAVFLQATLIAYRFVTRRLPGRWMILGGALASVYLALSIFSSRSGLKVLLWYLTFDRHTASMRLAIWDYAGDNVALHPMFGVGMEHWIRPSWMPESVDSFWLVTTLSFGLPATISLALALVFLLARVKRSVSDEGPDVEQRRAWAYTILSLVFVGFTVHYWNNVFVLFMFLIGSGGWMATSPKRELA